MNYHVYIVRCADQTLYTGVTTEIERRVEEHNSPDKGARYTRARQPVKLVYQAEFDSRSAAQKEEHRIKKLSRQQKLDLINSRTNRLND